MSYIAPSKVIAWQTAAALLTTLLSFMPTAQAHPFKSEADLRTHADVQKIEPQGPHNKLFETTFENLAKRFPKPVDELDIDAKVFTGSQNIIVDRASLILNKEASIPSHNGQKLYLKMFSTFYSQLGRTFTARLGLPTNLAIALATELERQAVVQAGVDYQLYVTQTNRIPLSATELYPMVLQALESLYATSTIVGSCDVPYLAGYSQNDANLIFIDRMIPLYNVFQNRQVPVGKLLNIHERVEKAILDDYQTTYPHAHQIALRLEKLSSDALGAPWKAYDDYITKVSRDMDSRVIDRVYVGLDMSPYLTWNAPDDVELVKTMRHAYVDLSQCPPSQK
jgi:hypothetical protein